VDFLVPPSVAPVTLHLDFICILKTTKNTTAQRDLANIVGIKMRRANQIHDHLDLIATLEMATIDTVFTAALKHFGKLSTSLNLDPTLAKTKISLITFATPPTESAYLQQRVLNDTKLQAQEAVGENFTKMEKKTTELFIGGNILTGDNIIQLIANFRVFWKCMIIDFDCTAIWATISAYKTIVISTLNKRAQMASSSLP
jgi:hypothetical protein